MMPSGNGRRKAEAGETRYRRDYQRLIDSSQVGLPLLPVSAHRRMGRLGPDTNLMTYAPRATT